MNRQHEHHPERPEHAWCNETRPTRLHYQLRCLLPAGHGSDHRWTPELLTSEPAREATG